MVGGALRGVVCGTFVGRRLVWGSSRGVGFGSGWIEFRDREGIGLG